MEQDSGMNGLENLDPMFLWKYVRLDKTRTTPRVIIYDDSIAELATEHHNCEFVLLTEKTFCDPGIPNVKLVWVDSLHDDRLYRLYSSADILMINEEQAEIWIPAMFCGVTIVHDRTALERELQRELPISLVARIENWEKAEKLIDFYKHK